jgi:AraC-like DNA-binding protein
MRSLHVAEPIDEAAPPASGRGDARTRVLRQGPGEAAWELWLREPLPALAPFLVGLWAGDADAPTASHRTLPDGELMLMFNLGHPQLVRHADGNTEIVRAAFVSGLQEHPLVYDVMVCHPRAVAVRFRPLGAWAFFGGLPLHELSNRVLDVHAVLGVRAGVEPLRQRLIEAPSLGAALDLLEGWVAARLFDGPRAHPMTRAAWARMHATGGTIRVAALAQDLGISARHLNDLLQREVGLSTKGVARVLRFERAMACLAAGEQRDLVGVAADCGYYDQAHLNRDFRELAGLTPTEIVARLSQAPGWREVSGEPISDSSKTRGGRRDRGGP